MQRQNEQGQMCQVPCRKVQEVSEKMAAMVPKLDAALEGVANFKAFQRDARDFFTEHRVLATAEESQRNKRDQEIKDALAAHYAQINQDNELLSNRIAKRNLFVGVASFFASLAMIALAIAAIVVSVWVSHHAMNNPGEILHYFHTAQRYTAQRESPPQFATKE
jgi:ribosomal protein L16 Arg81 hydroxylase